MVETPDNLNVEETEEEARLRQALEETIMNMEGVVAGLERLIRRARAHLISKA